MKFVALFLDVDGTIAPEAPDLNRTDWSDWTKYEIPKAGLGLATDDRRKLTLKIWLSLQLGVAIRELGVEIIWLSSWGALVDEHIAERAGLPLGLPVLGLDNPSLVKEAKFPLIKNWVEETKRPFIWADDVAPGQVRFSGGGRYSRDRDQAEDLCVPQLVIEPAARRGLRRVELDIMRNFIDGLQ